MELVVLVDEHNIPIGTADKSVVHTTQTPLHRAFSVFLFNSRQELLVTQRALSKKTFPGVWSNTVCGHPAPSEENEVAIIKRLDVEVGVKVNQVQFVSGYRYRFADQQGIVENEICPVYVAFSDASPSPNPDEIAQHKWVPWKTFLREITQPDSPYSPWCREEALLVEKYLQNQQT